MKKIGYWIFGILTAGLIVLTAYHEIQIQNLKSKHDVEYEKYSYPYDCMKEAELNYLESKTELVKEVQNYIENVASTSNLRGYAIVDECEKYNIDICFVLAQGEIESHFGTKGLGGKFNNVFNINVHDKVRNAQTMNKNYIYTYPNESIEPYLKLLVSKYLVDKTELDLLNNYVDINGLRYASSETYEEALSSKYKSIVATTNIKYLQEQMHNYAIKCNRIWVK